jgi:hypothetical protein
LCKLLFINSLQLATTVDNLIPIILGIFDAISPSANKLGSVKINNIKNNRNNKMKNIIKISGACAAMLLGSSLLIQAGSIGLPDGTALTTSQTAGASTSPYWGGTLVASLLNQSIFGPTGSPVGTVTSQVWTGNANNPYGLNAETFVYQIYLASASQTIVEGFLANNFAGVLTSVGWNTFWGPSGSLIPYTIDRNTPGGSVDFSFPNVASDAILPGGSSVTLVIDSNFTGTPGEALSGVQDRVQANVLTLSPNLPDGGMTVTLLGFALMAIEGIRRRIIS